MKKINLKNTVLITAAIMAFVVLSTDVMAQRGQRNFNNSGVRQGNGQGLMQNQRNFEPGQRCFNMLDLTVEQQEQINTLRVKQLEQMLSFRNATQEMRARLQTLNTAKNADMKAINSLIDEKSELKADQMKTRAAHHQEVRALLTDEQRVIFDSFRGMGRGGKNAGNGQGYRGNGFGRGQGQGYRNSGRGFGR